MEYIYMHGIFNLLIDLIDSEVIIKLNNWKVIIKLINFKLIDFKLIIMLTS